MKQDSCDAITLPNPRPMTLASAHSEMIHQCPSAHVTTTSPRKVIISTVSKLHLAISPILAPLDFPVSFAATTFVLSLFNLQTQGIKTENLIVSMAFAYGGWFNTGSGWHVGICLRLETPSEQRPSPLTVSTFLRCLLPESFGLILSPSSGILAAYATRKSELESALGLYLLSWVSKELKTELVPLKISGTNPRLDAEQTVMLLGSLRTSVALISLFFFLDVTFLLLAVSALAIGKLCSDNQALSKAGGVFGKHFFSPTLRTKPLISSSLLRIAWYMAAASLLEAENSFIRLPTIPLG
ncbi:hypothetical protein VP01_2265g1 [Puccinia sorghi]|uniref:Uncharacterized protein n=1 Tax=Puccinia sorghi TaxID=27349 RepID=A0A0L6V875_9BASI|nr:hypothetical protein VP01_2265g1 [Puccinia sorghi]